MDDSYLGYRFLVVVAVLLLNGFFAAAEVSLVAVRPSRLKQMVADGVAGAKAAQSLLARPERLLSVVQVGVTLASLGLGWAGENTFYVIWQAAFGPFVSPSTEGLFRGLSFFLTFLLMTYAHVVIGEVVPKNLAIERADRLAVLVAPVLLVFHRAMSPFVFVIERSASAVTRLLGARQEQRGGGHSAEELKLIAESSRRQGHLQSFEEQAITRLIDLQDLLVREIMVPRNEIVSLSVDASLDDMLALLRQQQPSRIPVYRDEPEHIIGVVHAKDLLAVWNLRRAARANGRPEPAFQVSRLMTKVFVVPETKPVNQLIDEFRQKHSHMAIVADEFGTIVGLVTMEDVLEQIFGEIEDEHDIHIPPVVPPSSEVDIDGGTSIRDLETQYAITIPVEAGFETLAGFLLYRLGHIPEAGETVEHETYRFTVLEMDQNRIAQVKVERIEVEDTEERDD